MPTTCPSCGHPLAGDTRVCPRCAHDLLESPIEGESLAASGLRLFLRSAALLGAALLGLPVEGRGLPERSRVRGRWWRVMMAGKVVAIGGCLWAVIAVYTAHPLQLWAAVPLIAVGLTLAILGRTSPEWSRG